MAHQAPKMIRALHCYCYDRYSIYFELQLFCKGLSKSLSYCMSLHSKIEVTAQFHDHYKLLGSRYTLPNKMQGSEVIEGVPTFLITFLKKLRESLHKLQQWSRKQKLPPLNWGGTHLYGTRRLTLSSSILCFYGNCCYCCNQTESSQGINSRTVTSASYYLLLQVWMKFHSIFILHTYGNLHNLAPKQFNLERETLLMSK